MCVVVVGSIEAARARRGNRRCKWVSGFRILLKKPTQSPRRPQVLKTAGRLCKHEPLSPRDPRQRNGARFLILCSATIPPQKHKHNASCSCPRKIQAHKPRRSTREKSQQPILLANRLIGRTAGRPAATRSWFVVFTSGSPSCSPSTPQPALGAPSARPWLYLVGADASCPSSIIRRLSDSSMRWCRRGRHQRWWNLEAQSLSAGVAEEEPTSQKIGGGGRAVVKYWGFSVLTVVRDREV